MAKSGGANLLAIASVQVGMLHHLVYKPLDLRLS